MNSSGHFLMVITNSANTVGQPTQGVPVAGEKPLQGLANTSVSGQGVWVDLGVGVKPLLRSANTVQGQG